LLYLFYCSDLYHAVRLYRIATAWVLSTEAILIYESGTDEGSSGSPVLKNFGGKLVIVALHKGGHCYSNTSDKVGYNYGILFSEILKWIRNEDFLKSTYVQLTDNSLIILVTYIRGFMIRLYPLQAPNIK